MNDLKEEKGTREELRRSQAAPRRSGGGLKRALMVILALVVVLAVVVAAAWKDLSSLDSVRRLFSYNKVTQDEQGKVEMYSFSNDRSNTFALLGDHLIVASTTGVSIYSSSGSVVDSMSVKLTNPAIAVGGQTAAVYDIGGQTLLIYSAISCRSASIPRTIWRSTPKRAATSPLLRCTTLRARRRLPSTPRSTMSSTRSSCATASAWRR